jgi:hypothetical protein
MGQKEKQKIEIEKLHPDPLPPLNQTVTADYSDFLGTALSKDNLELDQRFDVDFDTAFSTGPARPHGIAMK